MITDKLVASILDGVYTLAAGFSISNFFKRPEKPSQYLAQISWLLASLPDVSALVCASLSYSLREEKKISHTHLQFCSSPQDAGHRNPLLEDA
jgi:hypothetical protein